jgi:uncharacterized membrane protein YdcZ (DUF606 family)
MATIQVPATWMSQNYLPPICARHGGRATSFVPRKFYTRPPGWSYVLILVGVLIFAIVTLAIRTTVATALPACVECSRDRRRFIWLVLGGWVATTAIFVVGITFANDALIMVGFLAIVGALVFSFLGDNFRVSGHVNQDKVWVNLKRVDTTFAAAITNALRPAPHAVVAPAVPYQATPYQAAPRQPNPYQATPDILPGR